MAIAESEANSAAKARLRARARTRFNQSMKLVRRAHLYAGLFMTPWVFLYGVTAMLFNHPLVFSDIDQKNRSITPADLAGTPLANFPTPRGLAGQVVDAINASGGPDSTTRYQLVRPGEAAFTREYVTTVPGGSTDHTVRLDLASGLGSVRTAPSRNEAERESPLPFARRLIRLESAPMEAITTSVGLLLNRFGLPQAPQAPGPTSAPQGGEGERRTGRRDEGHRRAERPEASGRQGERGLSGQATAASSNPNESPSDRRAGGRPGGRGGALAGPELNFLMQGDGKVWRVGYNLQTGALTGRPDDAPRVGEPLSTRRFLLRLHTAHGYPSRLNSRWVWAVAVDVMFVCMVGWGLTGLLMWWQMKNVRRVGAILLVLSLIVSVAVAIGMHGMMAGGS
jgi:hypothetical protein